MKTRVIVMCPNPNDATSFWRAAGPISQLRNTLEDVEFVFSNKDIAWSDLFMFDVMLIQRPFNDAHFQLIKLGRESGLKVWVDYDDDFFSVPYGNPAYEHYNTKKAQQLTKSCIAGADFVTVSTKHLRDRLEPLNKNIIHIPNAWADHKFDFRSAGHIARAKTIFWRGGTSHLEDLDLYLPQMAAVAKRHSDWKFTFLGPVSPKIIRDLPPEQLLILQPLALTPYYHFIFGLGPKITIVPLVDSMFNRSKSNIAWQEASYAGSVALVPAWEEWQKPGSQTYNSPEEFESELERLLIPGTDLCSLSDMSWAFIRDNLSLSQINQMRVDLLSDLTGRKLKWNSI